MKKPRKSSGPKEAQLRLLNLDDKPGDLPGKKPKEEPGPSIQEWQSLYAAAAEFKQTAPWNWMWDSDVFGVKNPKSGEVGYCSVMGKLGEHLALAVYRGSEGLTGFMKIQAGAKPKTTPEFLELQECLMASFESRDYLAPDDRRIIKQLGLSFRGRNAWPLFRGYRPGYFPWFLTRTEAKSLTIVLSQTTGVAMRLKDDKNLLKPPEPDLHLVRVPDRNGQSWHDEWLKPEPLSPEGLKAEVDYERLKPGLLASIRKAAVGRGGTWEIGLGYFPVPVQEGKHNRPYYPVQIVVMDHNSGVIFATELAGPTDYVPMYRRQFLSAVKASGCLPERILTKGPNAFGVLKPLTSELSIPLEQAKRLPQVERFSKELAKSIPLDQH